MAKLRKKDIILALIIGELSALMMVFVGGNLSEENQAFVIVMPYAKYLLFVFPVLCAAGLFFAYLLSRIIRHFVFQLGKFCLVGGFNFLLDAAVLNFFIFTTGIAVGLTQSGFKGASFVVGVISSYLWNKHWTFKPPKTNNIKKEFARFLMVSGIGFVLNISIDYVLVNMISPFWNMPPRTWAQFSAVLAAAISLNWNFTGCKLFVFNNKKCEIKNVQNSVVSQISAAEL